MRNTKYENLFSFATHDSGRSINQAHDSQWEYQWKVNSDLEATITHKILETNSSFHVK